MPLPRANPDDVEFAQGSLVLSAPQSLRVNPAEVEGLRSISFAEAYQKIPAAPRVRLNCSRFSPTRLPKGKTKFSVTAERRQPQVTVDQLLQAEIDSGVVKFNATFFYDVKYSGVKSLRIDVPTHAGQRNPQHRQVDSPRGDQSPQPDDVAEGYTAWSFAAETELLGSSEVTSGVGTED